MALFNIDHTPAGLQGVTGALGGYLGTLDQLGARDREFAQRDRELANRETQLQLAQDSAALAAEEFKQTNAIRQQQVDLDAQQLAQQNQQFWTKLEADPELAEGIRYLREKGQDDILGHLRADDPTQSAAAFSAIQEAAQSAALEKQQKRVANALRGYTALEAGGAVPPGTTLEVQTALQSGVDPEVVFREMRKAADEHTQRAGKLRAFAKKTEGVRTVLSNPAAVGRMDPEDVSKAEDVLGDIELAIELGLDDETGGVSAKLEELDRLMAPKTVRENLQRIEAENEALKAELERQKEAAQRAPLADITQVEPAAANRLRRSVVPQMVKAAEAGDAAEVQAIAARNGLLWNNALLKIVQEEAAQRKRSKKAADRAAEPPPALRGLDDMLGRESVATPPADAFRLDTAY